MSVTTTSTWTCNDCGKRATTSAESESAPRPDGWGEPGNSFLFDTTTALGGFSPPRNLRCDGCRVALADAQSIALAERQALRKSRKAGS